VPRRRRPAIRALHAAELNPDGTEALAVDDRDLDVPRAATSERLDRRVAYGRKIGLLSAQTLDAATLGALAVFEPGPLFELLTLGDDVTPPENWDTSGSPLVVEPGPRAKARELKEWKKRWKLLISCYDALRFGVGMFPLMTDEDARGVERLGKNWRATIRAAGRAILQETSRADRAARVKGKGPRTAIRRRNLGLLLSRLVGWGPRDVAKLVLASEHDWLVQPCPELLGDLRPDDDDVADFTDRLTQTFENDLATKRRTTPRKKRASRARS
jgi:hypothetical protein